MAVSGLVSVLWCALGLGALLFGGMLLLFGGLLWALCFGGQLCADGVVILVSGSGFSGVLAVVILFVVLGWFGWLAAGCLWVGCVAVGLCGFLAGSSLGYWCDAVFSGLLCCLNGLVCFGGFDFRGFLGVPVCVLVWVG